MAPFSGSTRRATFVVSDGVLNTDPHGVRDSQGNLQGDGGTWNKFWHNWGYINDMASVAQRSSRCMTKLPEPTTGSTGSTGQTQGDQCTVQSAGANVNSLTCPSSFPNFSGLTKVSGDFYLYYTCCMTELPEPDTEQTQGDQCTVQNAGANVISLSCPSSYPNLSGLTKVSGDFFLYYTCCK